MPEASTGSRLEVSVFGQIVGARLPSGAMSHAAAALGLGSSAAHCTYRLSAGDGWACERGAAAGSSHTDWPASAGTFVWEQPVDATFVGPHLGGWPRVEVEVRWVDVHGRSEVAGYAAQHLPKTPGTHALSCRVWRPRGSLLERLSAFFVGASPQAPCITAACFVSRTNISPVACTQLTNPEQLVYGRPDARSLSRSNGRDRLTTVRERPCSHNTAGLANGDETLSRWARR